MTLPVTIDDVGAAAATIAGAVVSTPLTRSATLSEITGADVALKFENLQFTGSFKERGARNFLAHLDDRARARGVVAASAGNHAQGVAHHAHLLGIPATIVMPADTPFTKVTNTEHLGAHVELVGDSYAAAFAAATKLTLEGGRTLVPAFDDPLVIAGQGTVGLEMLQAAPDLDVIVVPVGGGGLIAGVAVAAKALNSRVHVVGVESAGYPSLAHALGQCDPPAGGSTIAEGIAVLEPGTIPLAIAKELVDAVLVVTEERIEEAIALGVEIEKTVLEGAGAAGLAAMLEYPEHFRGRRVGVVLSGGNIDSRVLSSVLLRALARSGRLIRLQIEVPDRPGVLATVADIVGSHRGNIVDVAHHRDKPGVALKQLLLELSVETRDRAHADEIVNALTDGGFRAARA
jgi:threonine dehydratase